MIVSQTCDTRFRNVPFHLSLVGRTGQVSLTIHFTFQNRLQREKLHWKKNILQRTNTIRHQTYTLFRRNVGWGWFDDTRDGTKLDAVSEIMSESGETIIAGNKR